MKPVHISVLVFVFLTVFSGLIGCSSETADLTGDVVEPESVERIVFNDGGVLYYDSPEVIFAADAVDSIAVVERGIKRLVYEPETGEKAVPLAVNRDYVYFAVEAYDRTEIKRVATFNLGGIVEDYGRFDRRLDAPYFINSEGDLFFNYVSYGEGEVRLLAYELPRAEPVAISPPLRGVDVTLFPAPEPDASYAVISRADIDADIYYFAEEGNETSLIVSGVGFEEYYLEDGRPFAVISELVSTGILEGLRGVDDSETVIDPEHSNAIYRTLILDLKGRGRVPVYSVSESGYGGGGALGKNDVSNVLDGDINTAWAVDMESELEDRVVKIDFARPRPIRGLKVYGGFTEDGVESDMAGRPVAVMAELSDGSAMEITFDENSSLAVAERESNKPVEWVVLTVDPVPTEGKRICFVNEVQLY
jgi:hypothetical protein